jgi:Domain of unknown function (DUF4365)
MSRHARCHRLDRMANDAFRFLIPHEWSFRRIEPDYGIGAGVEVFDAAGRPSGLRFHVQLTGAAEPAISKALRLPIQKEKLEYYRSLDAPVLMVRYHAPTGRFFLRWAFQDDLRDKRSLTRARKGNQIAFTWDESDHWDERSPFRIENDLRLMRQFREPRFSWPMRFTLRVEADSLSDAVKSRIGSTLRKQWTGMSSYIAIVDDVTDAHGSITLSPTMVRAALGTLYAVSIPLSEPYFAAEKLPSVPAHVLVLIAIALTRAGHVEMAARLCRLSFGRGAEAGISG